MTPKLKPLSEQVVAITGASSGIDRVAGGALALAALHHSARHCPPDRCR
jgi:NAD(P)-dependent dehydrogenase (short-subunit alcohol dehydrogenase family)